jgi:folate-dependent phosphoribosylglycinamide formyltransferase PurN
MQKVYEPVDGRKMRVAFMFSGGATGLKTNIIANLQHTDLYEAAFCLTDNPGCEGAEFARALKIPLETLDYKDYINKYSDKTQRRRAYCTDADAIMRDANPDIIVTTGFFLLLEDPFVRNWYGRLINGHPAKTYILASPNGELVSVGERPTDEVVRDYHQKGYRRMFVGGNAVYDAVVAGQDEVKTSVFFLDHGEDTGANIVHSQPVPVDREYVDSLINDGNENGLETYCKELQNLLKYYGDRPAINTALERAATGRLGLSDDVLNPQGLPYLAILDGKPLPYGGFQL